MPDITVTVQPQGGDAKTIDTPSDMRTGDFLDEVIGALNLPTRNEDGSPASYKVTNKTRGKELNDLDRTLADNGVKDRDVLRIARVVIAGGMPAAVR